MGTVVLAGYPGIELVVEDMDKIIAAFTILEHPILEFVLDLGRLQPDEFGAGRIAAFDRTAVFPFFCEDRRNPAVEHSGVDILEPERGAGFTEIDIPVRPL